MKKTIMTTMKTMLPVAFMWGATARAGETENCTLGACVRGLPSELNNTAASKGMTFLNFFLGNIPRLLLFVCLCWAVWGFKQKQFVSGACGVVAFCIVLIGGGFININA